jgi:hypothetical protein
LTSIVVAVGPDQAATHRQVTVEPADLFPDY